MTAIARVDLAFELDPRRIQDRTHRHVADHIYRDVFGSGAQITRVDETRLESTVVKALDLRGVDFHIALPNGMRLAGQEKFLSHSVRKFETVTVSRHSWESCTAQVYFVGYLTALGDGFDPWVLMNWANVVIDTASGAITWRYRESSTGYGPFWWVEMDALPPSCIVAASGRHINELPF